MRYEPRSLRTFTPSLAVLAKSAGVFHWTPEGRQLYDYTSGVLVSNLGHNPTTWMQRFVRHMGWNIPWTDSRGPETNGAFSTGAEAAQARHSR